MDVRWVKIRSWHAAKPHPALIETFCGRSWANATDIRNDLPAEKSCESCLRLIARLQDA